MITPLLQLPLRGDNDVVLARQRARQVAQLLGYDTQQQTRISTAVSEVARIAAGGSARVEYTIDQQGVARQLRVEIGPLNGQIETDESSNGAVIAAMRLMDRCELLCDAPGGRRVLMSQPFPPTRGAERPLDPALLVSRLQEQIRVDAVTPTQELARQNHDLMVVLSAMDSKQTELERLNAELFDTNRGVLALYAELDAQSQQLRRANDLKTRFLSDMSHEFRTPLNSILALTQLLAAHVDGELSHEQQRQIGYIRRSASELLELVNDLLDLAKVESGTITLKSEEFSINALFAALRGIVRPLVASSRVELLLEECDDLPPMCSDELRISQILRNLLSNAIKFTPDGQIRVAARRVPAGAADPDLDQAPAEDCVLFCVADTGVGIAVEDQERIFEEFTQVDNPLQLLARGTGLGLPLCRKLSRLLGGRVWVRSQLGVGSQFFVLLPLSFRAESAE